jgi:cell division protein FtsB
MAKNRKNQAAAIHFGSVFKVVLLCFLFCGSAVGYVWQKGEIARLGRQISEREKHLEQLKKDNKAVSDQLAVMHSPVMLDQRVRELKLGLAPVQPGQKILLAEPVSAPSENKTQPQLFAQRPVVEMTP